MNFAIISVILILLISFISTLVIAGKGDEAYRKETKRNTTNLTVIYTVVIILSIIAVGLYIQWFI
ncbi:hypothetical protein [Bacillus sp. B15-48]|uniref:hypothetical protein n=1 Tax=Bacillus sp. B15-48 TaxID=1548601 RepID=UPI00193EECB6|nr:hypothetical protein [Bacillus sp. B15-48]MBM4763314.1 hypothetical protein [Bacillus sp. B15-48]